MISKRLLRFALGPSFLDSHGEKSEATKENAARAVNMRNAEIEVLSYLGLGFPQRLVKQGSTVTRTPNKEEKRPMVEFLFVKFFSSLGRAQQLVFTNALVGLFVLTSCSFQACTVRASVFTYNSYASILKDSFFSVSTLKSFSFGVVYDLIVLFGGSLVEKAMPLLGLESSFVKGILTRGFCISSYKILEWTKSTMMGLGTSWSLKSLDIEGRPVRTAIVLSGTELLQDFVLHFVKYYFTRIDANSPDMIDTVKASGLPEKASERAQEQLFTSVTEILVIPISSIVYTALAKGYGVPSSRLKPKLVLLLQAVAIEWTVNVALHKIHAWLNRFWYVPDEDMNTYEIDIEIEEMDS